MTHSQGPVSRYPDSWNRHIDALAGPIALNVAGFETTLDITADQLRYAYFPLLAILHDLVLPNTRVLAGLAGIPGSGKSTFGGVLARVAQAVLPPGCFALVGMDGWHWPNHILDQRITHDANGIPMTLRRRKGGPESFDVQALATSLHNLQDPSRTVALPIYDRQIHDPVPDRLTISSDTRIVLVEGNYLLCNDPPWNQVSTLLCPKLYLDCDTDTARRRIIARHRRGGCSAEQAITKYQTNDQLNIDFVLTPASRADYHIQLTEPAHVQKLDGDPNTV